MKRSFTLACLTITLLAVNLNAQNWKPAPVTLTTEWGAKVTPDNAWREYPRPQFVRERWQNLNGLWDYAITAKTAPAPTKFDGQLLVPFAVETSLSAKAEAEGNPIETITSYFGMRKISLGAGTVAGQPALLLNGQPLFQHGPLDQGWWPDASHTPPSDEAMRWEIEWLRKAGFNMLRKHIKVDPALLREMNAPLTGGK